MATQEMAPEQADALARVLPHGLLEPARDYTGMGIALRAPARVRRLGLPCRDARVADVHWAGPWRAPRARAAESARAGAALAPRWGHWHHRRGQLRGIVRHLEAAPQRRRVLVGDLNCHAPVAGVSAPDRRA